MRLVLISDTHGLHRGLRVPDGDVLIHAGDIAASFLGGHVGKAQDALNWLNELPHPNILFVPGNHDSVYGQHYFNMGRVVWMKWARKIQGLTFFGQGWGQKYSFEHTDVLITHQAPFGICDGVQGCRELRRRVKAYPPLVHVFGHVHEGHGQRRIGLTTFCNSAMVNNDLELVHQPAVIDVGAT